MADAILVAEMSGVGGGVQAPVGVVFGGVRYTVIDGSGAVVGSQETTSLTVTFSGLGAGTYVASAVSVGSDGVVYGSPMTAAFTVVPATVEVPVVLKLTATV